jgi:hypothetical protein
LFCVDDAHATAIKVAASTRTEKTNLLNTRGRYQGLRGCESARFDAWSWRMLGRLPPLLALGALLTGCGQSSKPPPPPPKPTRLAITVIDAATRAPISGAEVLFLEEDKPVHTSDANGALLLDLAPGTYTILAHAAGYLPQPLPGHVGRRVKTVEHETLLLEIGLEPRPNAVAGGTLSGAVTHQGTPVPGALVIAKAVQSFSALTDSSGKFSLLGVAPGLYQIAAHDAGFTSTTKMNVNVDASTHMMDVTFELTPSPGATVGGRLAGGSGTSTVVLLDPDSGDAIPGLSAQASFGGTYAINGVPPGTYRIETAREIDGVTFDPEWVLMHGAPMVMVTDTSSRTVDLLLAPTVMGIMPATTSSAGATPTLSWSAVPMADYYVVEVRDVLGTLLYGGFDVNKSPRMKILSPSTSVMVSAQPALAMGQLYAWRVYAAQMVNTGQLFQLIAASEEQGGEFRVTSP